jgi:hypothetical protein
MCSCLFGCPVALHARKENVVGLLLSGENRALLKYYRYALSNDPDYLRFHGSSTALRICTVLMIREYPHIALGDDVNAPDNCCVLEALKEAIERMESDRGTRPDQTDHPQQERRSS